MKEEIKLIESLIADKKFEYVYESNTDVEGNDKQLQDYRKKLLNEINLLISILNLLEKQGDKND